MVLVGIGVKYVDLWWIHISITWMTDTEILKHQDVRKSFQNWHLETSMGKCIRNCWGLKSTKGKNSKTRGPEWGDPYETRCSPRTRMLTRMLMVQMSAHMDMQSRRTLLWNSWFQQSCFFFPVTKPVHRRLWNMEKGGVQSMECRVWSVKCGMQSVKCGVWSVECGV